MASEKTTDPKRAPPKSEQGGDLFRKTELCRFFSPHADRCEKGPACPFAHGVGELRSRPDLKKTSLCKLWLRGKCSKCKQCQYAHGSRELRSRTSSASTSGDLELGMEWGVQTSSGASSSWMRRQTSSSQALSSQARTPEEPCSYCPTCFTAGHDCYAQFCAWCGATLVHDPALAAEKCAEGLAGKGSGASSSMSPPEHGGDTFTQPTAYGGKGGAGLLYPMHGQMRVIGAWPVGQMPCGSCWPMAFQGGNGQDVQAFPVACLPNGDMAMVPMSSVPGGFGSYAPAPATDYQDEVYED